MLAETKHSKKSMKGSERMNNENNLRKITVDKDGRVIGAIALNDIKNYNFEGMCSEERCDEPYTHTFAMTVNGLKMIIPVCEKHAKEMEKFSENYFLSG